MDTSLTQKLLEHLRSELSDEDRDELLEQIDSILFNRISDLENILINCDDSNTLFLLKNCISNLLNLDPDDSRLKRLLKRTKAKLVKLL